MEQQYTVLICDDSEAIHGSLRGYLEEAGFRVCSVYDGESALRVLRTESVHLLLLDVMLPGIDGFQVCREARKFSDVYIIMLSARGDDGDKVQGMELGADDYVAKPFSPRVVAIRIERALSRLGTGEKQKKYQLAELTVYPDAYRVFVGGQEIQVSSKEVEVLAYFLENQGKVLTREHILNAAWGYDYVGDTRVVDSLIKRLRHKLIQDGVHFSIRSVYGAGYKIEALS